MIYIEKCLYDEHLSKLIRDLLTFKIFKVKNSTALLKMTMNQVSARFEHQFEIIVAQILH